MGKRFIKEGIKVIGFVVLWIFLIGGYIYLGLRVQGENVNENLKLLLSSSLIIGIASGWGSYSVYKHRKIIKDSKIQFYLIQKLTFELIIIIFLGMAIYKIFFK